ncbi:Hypothetical protein R9X50_00280000 [Acrodontium crateriforme]|uniref:Uncharacterized protein n=1 Tax=Acrodontium crateriforme TaxID=150365 RepID=A0AAQ3M2V4_9PEZI|nr:Hypothetical protein R9X50_00280000 [Acrodontium crateriforme]
MAQVLPHDPVRQKSSSSAYSTSLLYSSLPSLIQDRVPKIPSLRRIATTFGSKNVILEQQYEDLQRHRRLSSTGSDFSTAPPPSYHEEDPGMLPTPPRSRPVSSHGTTLMTSEEENESGVQWENVNHGFWLLSHTLQNVSSALATPELVRRLYISSMEYFLAGLPEDLTKEEVLKLRLRLPTPLLPEEYDATDARVVVRTTNTTPTESNDPPSQPEASVLHRLTANITLYTFLALAFLLPYIKLFLQKAYAYDRQHKISDRVIEQSLLAAETISQKSLHVAGGVCAINDGKVGEAAKLLVLWWVQGLSGGVCEGVGDGMKACGMRVNSRTRMIELDDGSGEENA